MRECHKETVKKRENFQLRNQFLKDQTASKQKEAARIEKLYYQMYLWCFVIKFYKVMEEIDNRYTRQKLEADHSLLLTTSVKRIQRKFRWTMRFLSNSQSRIRKTGFLSLNLRAFWVRGSTRKDAKKLI